jgi:hypothetical protein
VVRDVYRGEAEVQARERVLPCLNPLRDNREGRKVAEGGEGIELDQRVSNVASRWTGKLTSKLAAWPVLRSTDLADTRCEGGKLTLNPQCISSHVF